MLRRGISSLLPLLLLVGVACQPGPSGGVGDGGDRRRLEHLRLNDIQVLASHNSYHIEPEPKLFDLLRGFLGEAADGFQYTHQPLTQELDLGVRQVELDVFVDDPEGGRYAAPKLVPVAGLEPVDPRMAEPGLKVFHGRP